MSNRKTPARRSQPDPHALAAQIQQLRETVERAEAVLAKLEHLADHDVWTAPTRRRVRLAVH